VVVRRRPREPRLPSRRWDLALQTEAVIGASEMGFYNHLIGAHLGFRINRSLALRLYGAYGNFAGRGQRAHNFLALLMFESRIKIATRFDLTVPLRAGIGYLPFNGPVVRLSAGFNLPIAERYEIGIDLLSPTFWVLPDQTLASFDIGIELIYRIGKRTTPSPDDD
jgi:hypothetical protein